MPPGDARARCRDFSSDDDFELAASFGSISSPFASARRTSSHRRGAPGAQVGHQVGKPNRSHLIKKMHAFRRF